MYGFRELHWDFNWKCRDSIDGSRCPGSISQAYHSSEYIQHGFRVIQNSASKLCSMNANGPLQVGLVHPKLLALTHTQEPLRRDSHLKPQARTPWGIFVNSDMAYGL